MRLHTQLKRVTAIFLSSVMIASSLATPAYAVYSYYSADGLTDADKGVKEWTWSADAEKQARDLSLVPTGLSQQQTAIMGGYTTKFWFQNQKAKTAVINHKGQEIEIDFSDFNHRYYSCADSHNSGWFAPVGSQMVFKKMYYPTKDIHDYPEFIQNAPLDMEEKKFLLLMTAMLSAAYDTPSADELKDSDQTSMYYYLLWLSIWANDIYAEHGAFRGNTPEEDWDYVRDMVRVGYLDRLNPDVWGSTSIYDAFRDGGPAQRYFFNCWRAAKFLSAFDYAFDIGTSLPISAPTLGEDGMYHMVFDYSGLGDYEKEVYRRLTAHDLADGWEYENTGSQIAFKSPDGKTDGDAVAVLRLRENSEEDHFYNCGFGIGGLAGFQGCAKGDKGVKWGNTQVYFSAISQPLEILVGASPGRGDGDFDVEVRRFEHEETWNTHYNVMLRKYDSETGQPLAGSKWDILEAFDSGQLSGTKLESKENWANASQSQFIKWDGWDYGEGYPDGDIENDPCPHDVNITNEDGLLMMADNDENATANMAHTDIKTYTYHKGYCGGHPDPVIEESGDLEIDAQLEADAWDAWEEQVKRCEELAAAGGFFHSIEEGTAREELEADRDEYYRQFVSLKYEYSAVELTPRPGYTKHGGHTDDIPIEMKTVTSSEFKADSIAESLKTDRVRIEGEATPSSATRRMPVQRELERRLSKGRQEAGASLWEVRPSEATPSEVAALKATPSEATASNAAAVNGEKRSLLSRLRELFEERKSLLNRLYHPWILDAGMNPLEEDEVDYVDFEESEVAFVSQGDGTIVDHTFIVYDHRTEGEIHINKRDLGLEKGKTGSYDAYGDTQGDGTLEGAVYGLFAARDIVHPDGHSGIIFQADDLVAMAAVDRNGDASFMAITEAPGMTYNYESGEVEKRTGGFRAPVNLHRARAAADLVSDMENYLGHTHSGQAVRLLDSIEGDGYSYQKLSSNQAAVEGSGGANTAYPIMNNEELNGSCWIGRPLIVEENGTSYYVKELNRSEGYELSVSGKTNGITNGRNNYNQGYKSADVEIGKITLDNAKNGNYFQIKAENVNHDIDLKGLNFPEGAAFSLSVVTEVPEKIKVPVYTTVQKPVMAAAGSYVYKDGKRVEASIGDMVTFSGGQTYPVLAVLDREDKTIGVKPLNYHTMGTPEVTELNCSGDAAAFMDLYNEELEKAGYRNPGEDAPWVRVELTGTTDMEWIMAITQAMKDNDLTYFNSLRISQMLWEQGSLYAILRYEWRLYGDDRDSCVYVPGKDRLYVKKDGGNGYFVYASYDDLGNNPAVVSVSMKDGFLERATVKDQSISGLAAVYPEPLPRSLVLVNNQTPAYWVYAAGSQQLDNAGNLKFTEETKVDYEEKQGVRSKEKTVKLNSAYEAETKAYTVTIPAKAFLNTNTISMRVSDDGSGRYSIRQAYIDGGYFAAMPLNQTDDSYVASVLLTKPAADIPVQDGGTRVNPASVLERPIKQKIKIIKELSPHGPEQEVEYLPNFRFKIYLKSNLERLYRDEDGQILWQDRNGNMVDISAYRRPFPERVQKIYTMVPHKATPLIKDSNQAAIANTELYAYMDGLICEDSNPGFTSLLETIPEKENQEAGMEESPGFYNYEKFFGAIRVANGDKWDRAHKKSTSFKPFASIRERLFGFLGGQTAYPAKHDNPRIKNEANTSEAAYDNSSPSDRIRQFAITWYLDEEVKKLVQLNQAGQRESADQREDYQDQIYDTALARAMKKAENYLKPFFTYDLDEIYAIPWDSEAGGGKDKDETTLSADLEDVEGKYCYGISEYLPYGTYVVVEQQPWSKELNDLYNKHYKIDAPKELELPAVYEDGRAGADQTPERLSSYYNYDAKGTASELASKYFIRFGEEWPGENGDDLRRYIIRAHGFYGDYEIYKYGLDLDKLGGTAEGDPAAMDHFSITQSPKDPGKDYYNTIVDPEERGGNPDSHYYADDRNTGREAANGSSYEPDAIEKIYHYGSVSEDKKLWNNVEAMEGVQIAFDKKYAPMLVPWTVTEPADELTGMMPGANGEASYQGYAWKKYRNTFYTGRLRIEKLDLETGENILHDGAVFTLYAARREEEPDTDGLVRFYDKETLIKGSKEFLEAMGAKNITTAARRLPEGLKLWTGYVPEGTPVCSEADQVILADQEGRRTGQFEAFTTTRDGPMEDEEDLTRLSDQDQNTGYLITPQPLEAGTYVLCEARPPAGYARTKPVAIEIYSDQVSYYLDGNRDQRVAAAIYQDREGKGAQKILETARVYVGNAPVRLEAAKVKDKRQDVTWRTDTRLEGSLAELKAAYGSENLEYAYKNGNYLGYGWPKGTLEYLESRKAAGETVDLVYEDGVFAGYALITRSLDSANHKNRYVAGAVMTLYDAIEVKPNGDSGDYGYDGVVIERDRNSNVQSMKVQKGYGGTTVEFVRKEDLEGSLAGEAGEGTWSVRTIEREDTDILYYSLSDLRVTKTGADGRIYGYNRDGKRVLAKNQTSIFAMKNGRPQFEITGGDLVKVRYSPLDKCFLGIKAETIIYHLDQNGVRDAMVNPETGMAYVIERTQEANGKEIQRILVWPVKVVRTASGTVIAREKIHTGRIASINADTENEYTVGTYNGRKLEKTMNPVLDGHGLPEYYQRSGQVYKKGQPVYEMDGDYVHYKYDDLLPAYNHAAYSIDSKSGMEDIGREEEEADDKKLFHRKGEPWIMENTWITGERWPNDPFAHDTTRGQVDLLKRVIPGVYIMEEQKAPSGYAKGFPSGLLVGETDTAQDVEMAEERIKVEIVKTDGTEEYKMTVKSDYQEDETVKEPKGAYGYNQVTGARLALYKARRVATTDYEAYPNGYYLEKAEDKPAQWVVDGADHNEPVVVVADWVTDGTPKYFEGIPAGDYILEELEAADGYIPSSLELEVKPIGQVQSFHLKNDHTKLELYKYYRDSEGGMRPLPNQWAAELALYEAQTDEAGNILVMDGKPQFNPAKEVAVWTTDDLTEYADSVLGGRSGFTDAFEEGYRKKGSGLTYVDWKTQSGMHWAKLSHGMETGQGESVAQTWLTDKGKTIRITIYRDLQNGALDKDGNLPLRFEYQFNYQELPGGVKSYDNSAGIHRIDYLRFNAIKNGHKVGNYVLVEKKTPNGFKGAKPKAIVLTESGDIKRYSLENTETYIDVLKVLCDSGREYPAKGAKLALYRADQNNDFVQDPEHFIEGWISGTDGSYTEQDQRTGIIPDGLKPGDLKPHRISKIPYGVYYLTEAEAPQYMVKGEPVSLEIDAHSAALVRVVNKPTQGCLEIHKRARDTQEPLENARFLVTNRDTGDYWYVTCGRDGKAVLPGLLVGLVKPDGTIIPYTYAIEEVSPPDLYQISGGKKFFQFDAAVDTPVVNYLYEVENNPTEIRFRKTNFDTGMLVEGAEIAVYHAKAVDGEYKKEGEAIETVLCGLEGFSLTKKLSANHVYIMEERKAPPGMHVSNPVLFRINQAGTGIQSVSHQFGTFNLEVRDGAIEALQITGRMANKVYQVLTDLDTGEMLPALIGSTSMSLTKDHGIIHGHLYEIAEYTRYSDGNTCMSRKETKRLYLDENGQVCLPARTYLETIQILKDGDGMVLDRWTVDEDMIHTIRNPVVKEPVFVRITGDAGRENQGVLKGDVVKYSIAYENPGNEPEDIAITAMLHDGLELIRATGHFERLETGAVWSVRNLKPGEKGSLELTAAVVTEPGDTIKAEFAFESGRGGHNVVKNVLINPVVRPGSLTLRNHISGTGKDLEDRFTYYIRFMDQSGRGLIGYQNYTGSKEGRLKGAGAISLKGEEFITFPGLPYGTRYEIALEERGDEREKTVRQGSVSQEPQTVVYDHVKNDQTQREVLAAGGSYCLAETTLYSDGTELATGIYRFSLNESGVIDNVDMEDSPVTLYFSKVDIDTGEELAGGHYTLQDAQSGEIIYEYDKVEAVPVLIPTELLKPGGSYLFREELSPDGYAYEEEIRFTVNEDAIPETVVMQDKKTRIYFEKIDADTGEPLRGGRYQIKDAESGETVFSYAATGEKVLLEGRLKAGGTYVLHEELPPEGYAYGTDIPFTVPKGSGDIQITMEDKITEIQIEKLAGEASDASPSKAVSTSSNYLKERHRLAGAVLSILNEDGSPVKALRDDETRKKGENLVITTTDELTLMKGQLMAGTRYWLHEETPAPGYAYARDVAFVVAKDGERGKAVMTDLPTHVVLSKKDIGGSRELPGNHLSVWDENGGLVEEWISQESPHEIVGKLEAGKTYVFREELPALGYTYGEEIRFTVHSDGTVNQVEMKNEPVRIQIRKTDIGGKLLRGAVLQILDQEKKEVLLEFETGEGSVEITGVLKAGAGYYLHEKKAPEGYLLSADVPFTVPRKAGLVEVVMVDEKKDWPDQQPKKMRLLKTDALTGKRLPGFTFTIYEPGGGSFETVTGSGGYAVFHMPPDGVYRFRETKAAEGYLLSEEEYTFTIADGKLTDNSTVVVADRPVPVKEVRSGRITAEYKARPGYRGKKVLGGRITGKKTGDNAPVAILLAAFAVCALGIMFTHRKGEGEKSKRNKRENE